MADIVKRLRTEGALAGHYAAPAIQIEAADEIDRLREALRHVITWVEQYPNRNAILPYNTKPALLVLGEYDGD